LRKIDLTPYQVDERPYDVKTSVVNLLFNPELKLSGRDVITQDELAKKIESSDDSVLLEEVDYQKVKKAIDVFSGFSRADVGFVTRILSAPEVKVKEQ
jgi:predicted ABC-type ATPase